MSRAFFVPSRATCKPWLSLKVVHHIPQYLWTCNSKCQGSFKLTMLVPLWNEMMNCFLQRSVLAMLASLATLTFGQLLNQRSCMLTSHKTQKHPMKFHLIRCKVRSLQSHHGNILSSTINTHHYCLGLLFSWTQYGSEALCRPRIKFKSFLSAICSQTILLIFNLPGSATFAFALTRIMMNVRAYALLLSLFEGLEAIFNPLWTIASETTILDLEHQSNMSFILGNS